MAKLPKFTLDKNEKKGVWELTNDKTNKIIKSFEVKTDALKGGILKRLLGEAGGSVKIQKENGRFQKEQTYPDASDPRQSKG